MLKINSPLFANIEFSMFGSLKEVILLRDDLMRYVSFYSYLTDQNDEYQIYKISFTVQLSKIDKVNKIIEKHTHYFSDIKKYKERKIIKEGN